MSYQGLCKAGSGGELTVTSWAWSRPQEELLVWPCSVGQGSPRARHLLLLGKHRQLPLCLMPAQCDHAAMWAGGNLHPQRPDSADVLQKPGSTQLWSTHSRAASNTSSSRALRSQRHPGWQERKPGLENQSFCPAPAH